MKVFQVNDCDCVAAETVDQARNWYMNEYQMPEDECDYNEEVSLDTGMWVDIYDISENEQDKILEISKDKSLALMTYEWVLKNIYPDKTEPFHISSTEF